MGMSKKGVSTKITADRGKRMKVHVVPISLEWDKNRKMMIHWKRSEESFWFMKQQLMKSSLLQKDNRAQ